jgi:tRNA pseudouridine38-40 synthase
MQHGVRLTVAYDGTDFAGFQRQPNARTVQQVLEEAAQEVTRHPVRIPDAGVHAEGQIAAFATTRLLPPRRWLLALNRYLPDDAAVRDVVACAPDYGPRFDAMDKTYRYLFHLGFARDPLRRHRAFHLGRYLHIADDACLPEARALLDLGAMRQTCQILEGTHDFRAFRAADDVRENSTRTLHRVELIEAHAGNPHLLALEVQGTAFMKQMVRIMAGAILAVGRGRRTPEAIAAQLCATAVRDPLCETAPAHGLTLVQVTLGRQAAQASRSAP